MDSEKETDRFNNSDQLWSEENYELYSSYAETTAEDFNYAEVASCDEENSELDKQQHNSKKQNHTMSNNTSPTESFHNRQSQQYNSDNGNMSLYKYTQSTSIKRPSLNRHTITVRPQFNITIDESLSKLAVTPIFRRYQLLGDSQLVRFSETVLGLRRWRSRGRKARIGYCVSGQCVAELGTRIRAAECRLISEVVVLIGTNDMRKNTDVLSLVDAYSDLVNQLKQRCQKIVLLTVPPLPFVHDKDPKKHFDRLKYVNGFIKGLANGDDVFVLDLCSIFVSFDNTVSKEYFEKFIRADQIDLIHLNICGLKMLRTLLDTLYFDKYNL